MKNSYLIYLLIFIIYTCSCGTKEVVNDSNLGSIAVDTFPPEESIPVEKRHGIKSFLGFKSGMSVNDVIKRLDSLKIKHSMLISSKKLLDQNLVYGADLQFHADKSFFIEVYKYPVGRSFLDSFYLFFFKNQLFLLNYYKFSEERDIGKNNNGLNNSWLFYVRHRNNIQFIVDALLKKYGRPNHFGNESLRLQENMQDYGDNNGKKVCDDFQINWLPLNQIEDLDILIKSSWCQQHWFSNDSRIEETHDYDKNYIIIVRFYNEMALKLIRSNLDNFLKKPSQVDSINTQTNKLIDEI
jgi:hypothetical protein